MTYRRPYFTITPLSYHDRRTRVARRRGLT
jgi:hypothetical protein